MRSLNSSIVGTQEDMMNSCCIILKAVHKVERGILVPPSACKPQLEWKSLFSCMYYRFERLHDGQVLQMNLAYNSCAWSIHLHSNITKYLFRLQHPLKHSRSKTDKLMASLCSTQRCRWYNQHNLSNTVFTLATANRMSDGLTPPFDSCCCSWRHTSRCCPVSWDSRVRTTQRDGWCLHRFPIYPAVNRGQQLKHLQKMQNTHKQDLLEV